MAGRNEDERIREIISWIIDNEEDDPFDTATMHARLEEQGYSSEEIRQAMILLEADSKRGDNLFSDGFERGNRVFSTSERNLLSLDAQGWLLWLRSAGWLSETQLSLIIESTGLEYRAPASIDEVMEITLRYVPSIPAEMEVSKRDDLN